MIFSTVFGPEGAISDYTGRLEGGGPDCPFPKDIDDFGPSSARIRVVISF